MKSSLPFTSVVSYHTNPFCCGVAKFGSMLAERLGVPFTGLDAGVVSSRPLFSVKASELSPDAAWTLQAMCFALHSAGHSCGFFWHDTGLPLHAAGDYVFYADPSLGSPGLWCPSMIPITPRPVKLFSFGMAHKLQTTHYAKVKRLLDDAGKRYHLRVSVGLHEGTSLSDATDHFDALKAIMGAEHVTILGCLSDEAVSEELHHADYVLAFFNGGVRLNNTTVHAALDHGCKVITNGSFTQCAFHSLFDIDALTAWPNLEAYLTWDALIEQMEEVCAVSA